MQSPYTSHEIEALMMAQTSVGLTLTALVWGKHFRPRVSAYLFLAAIWLAAVAPCERQVIESFGPPLLHPEHMRHLLRLCALLAGLGGVVSGRRGMAVVGVIGAGLLWWARNRMLNSEWELASANLLFVGVLIGMWYRSRRNEPAPVHLSLPSLPFLGRKFLGDDLFIFLLATGLGVIMALWLLGNHTNSGDEWANTFQAAVFLKGKAFAGVPHCKEAFRSYWVYQYENRSFAQYTPAWPMFMAPFLGLHMVWLASPVSFGLLAVGIARIARRAAAGFAPDGADGTEREARLAGLLAGLAVTLGATMLINAGSRYPHVFVAATFAWACEGLLEMTTPGISRRAQWGWGLLVGTSAAMMVGARPADGITLHVGLVFYLLYATFKRRVGVRAFGGSVLAWALWGGLMLLILRLQLGVWFKTGYSITEHYYSWNKLKFSIPKPDEVRASVPLAVGSYCWWPCSPALGLAGLVALRGKARRISFIMLASFVPYIAFYVLFEIGRHGDAGYGPRYQFPWVVPMAVGTGAILAQLWVRGRAYIGSRGSLSAGGPIALALTASLLGTAVLFPLLYPVTRSSVNSHNRLQNALAKHPEIRHAVILGHDGVSSVSTLDLTEDLPLDLYPNQDVLIARANSAESEKCVRETFRDRRILHARMKDGEVHFEADKGK